MKRETIKKIAWFIAKRMVYYPLIIYALLLMLAYFVSDRMIFTPQPSSYEQTDQVLKLTTEDGVQIAGVYFPNPEAHYTILFSHGNAEDIGDLLPLFEDLKKMGFEVFGYDYRGYGLSQGKSSEKSTYKDINAAYDYLTGHLAVPSNRVIVYGRSVGSGPAVDLAARKPVAGLILESPFTTAFRVMTRIPILPFDKFRNIDKIKIVNCPLLIMHGKADQVIPFWHGQQLFDAAPEPKRYLWVDEAGHNDFMDAAGNRYRKAIEEFSELLKS